jgi:hypothetical protein
MNSLEAIRSIFDDDGIIMVLIGTERTVVAGWRETS